MDLEEIKPEIALLRGAYEELKSCQQLKRILAAVLAIGNALNGGTFRGSAMGFKLEDLSKLRDTRSNSSREVASPTLLHFIVRALKREDPSLVDFCSEMPHLEPASRGVQRIDCSSGR